MIIELDVPKAQDKNGVLSVLGQYNFEVLELKMQLEPKLAAKSHNNKKALVEIEKTYMLNHSSEIHKRKA